MGRRATAAFDAKTFLTKASTGQAGSAYRKKQVVFAQGDPADAVFYRERGQIKLTVVSDQGKSAVVALLGRGTSLAKGVSRASPFGWPPRPRSPTCRSCESSGKRRARLRPQRSEE